MGEAHDRQCLGRYGQTRQPLAPKPVPLQSPHIHASLYIHYLPKRADFVCENKRSITGPYPVRGLAWRRVSCILVRSLLLGLLVGTDLAPQAFLLALALLTVLV